MVTRIAFASLVVCWFGCRAAPVLNLAQQNIPNAETLRFLKRFGYLKDGPPDADALYKESAVRSAIQTMQHFGAIPETGEIDNATLQLMATPSLANWSPKLGGHEPVFQELSKAFDMWSGYSRLSFQPVHDPAADIVVAFGRHYHGDGYPFDGPNGILAHAYFPYEMDQYGGDIHFDDDEEWAFKPPDTSDGVDFFTVATHELGHSLGLSHSPVPASVMFPYYKGYSPYMRLDYDDIMAMYQLYITKPLQDEDTSDNTDDHDKAPAPPASPPSSPPQSPPEDPQEDPPEYPSEDPPESPGESPPSPPEDPPPPPSPPYHPEEDDDEKSRETIDPTYEGDFDTVDGHREKGRTTPMPPDVCAGNYTAMSVLRGELFVFKGQFVWRLSRRGLVEYGYPVSLRRMFPGFPEWVDRIDAVYERPTDGSIIFFVGSYFWVSDGDKFLDSPRPITEYGIPNDVDHVDAALVWGKNGKTYLYSGDRYWRYLENETRLDEGYPKSMDLWRGVPSDLDAAMRWTDGQTYFFKGKAFWRFNDAVVMIDERYPLPSPQYWFGCPEEMTDVWW